MCLSIMGRRFYSSHRFRAGNVEAKVTCNKPHYASDNYPTMYHVVKHMHISVANGALWDICPIYCGICEMGLLDGMFDFVAMI